MKIHIAGHDFWLSVISSDRPENVAPTTVLAGPATWYLPAPQMPIYAAAGASHFVPVPGDPPENLVHARNAAINDAFSRNLISLQLDDDAQGFFFLRNYKLHPLSMRNVIRVIMDRWQDPSLGLADAHLAGIYFAKNKSWMGHKLSRVGLVRASFTIIRPCSLRYDPKMHLRDDYDYSLQHIAAFGLVARHDDICGKFGYRSNSGGIQAWNIDRKRLEIVVRGRMLRKWGTTWVVPDKRFPSEIGIRSPRLKFPVAPLSLHPFSEQQMPQ